MILARLFQCWRDRLRPRLHWLRARPRMHVLERWEGTARLGPAIAIFAHFDPHGDISGETISYLRALAESGFSVVLVSNSGQLSDSARLAALPLCAAILIRRNIGLDFAAWHDAMQALELPRAETEMLLLVNDSMHGPFWPLGPTLARMDFARADIWGLTESAEVAPHLQSYFLAAGPVALRSPAWASFWRRVRPLRDKTALIRLFEIGFSTAMRRAGLRLAPLFPTPLDGSNPTLARWRGLLNAGFPFVKRELVRTNPLRDPMVSQWREIVEDIRRR